MHVDLFGTSQSINIGFEVGLQTTGIEAGMPFGQTPPRQIPFLEDLWSVSILSSLLYESLWLAIRFKL